MSDEDLDEEATIKLPIGHLLIVWDILANKNSDLGTNDNYTDDEKRAIWALQDLCENELLNKGISGKPKKEWDELIDRATEFVKTIPAEFLD
ncbi:MAG: hypothetical protein ABW118_14955 [Candidatus Thiodiazotropha sp.]